MVFEADINGGGEIILGGAGNDIIRGNLGNDVLDGDAWLNVRISVNANKERTGGEIATFDSLTSKIAFAGSGLPASWQELNVQTGLPTGLTKNLAELMRTGVVNPGQLEAVREILNSDGTKVSVTGETTNLAGDVDIAVFSDVQANYVIELDGLGNIGDGDNDGFITIQHTPPGGGGGGGGGAAIDDGTDKIRNFEVLQFADAIQILDPGITNAAATGNLGLADSTPGTPPQLGDTFTATLGNVADADGLPLFSTFDIVWQVEADPVGAPGVFTDILDPITGGRFTGPAFTPGANSRARGAQHPRSRDVHRRSRASRACDVAAECAAGRLRRRADRPGSGCVARLQLPRRRYSIRRLGARRRHDRHRRGRACRVHLLDVRSPRQRDRPQ